MNKQICKGNIVLNEKVIISDPSYGLNKGVCINNMQPGNYNCYVQYFYTKGYRRVKSISIKLKKCNIMPDEELGYTNIDSGLCGIYDYKYYTKYHSFKENECIDDNKLNSQWYNKVISLGAVQINNPAYVEFEKSKFWQSEFAKDYMNKLKNDEEYLQLLSKRLDAKHIYEKTVGREFVDAQDANIIDNKGFVSAAGYGEGSCLITIGKNEKEKVVAIKITY